MMFNKQTRRKFNKLQSDEKKKAIELAVTEGVNKALAKHIPLAFTRGVKYEDNALYDKYVRKIDMAPEGKEAEEVENLLSHLRLAHVAYLKATESETKEGKGNIK